MSFTVARWTAANTQEALTDPVTPLTWTFLVPFVERGRRELFAATGFEEIDGAYMRLIAGRAYFNPDYFRRFLAQLPGVPTEIFDALIFGEGRPEVTFRLPEWTPRTLRAAALLAGARLGFGPDRLDRAARRAEARIAAVERSDLDHLDAGALLGMVDAVMPHVERALRLHVLATALSGASYLLLDLVLRMLGVSGGGAAAAGGANLPARLTAGARPTLQAVANAHLFDLLALPPGEDRERRLRAFLARFGHRSVHEAELAAPRWSEDPSFVRRLIEQTPAARRQVHPVARERRVRARARALERAVDRAIARRGGILERLIPVRRLLYRQLVREARAYAPYREDVKSRALRGLAVVRRAFVAIGERLAVRGLLAAPADVFFLDAAEARRAALAVAHGGRAPGGLAERASARRARHAELVHLVPPRLVEAPAHAASLYIWDDPRVRVSPAGGEGGGDAAAAGAGGRGPRPAAGTTVLGGVGASAGRVRARARVLERPEEGTRLAAGEVLVARVLNAGWTPLFLVAGAAVADLGGVLSHAAVIAREFGIPLVTGTRHATRVIRDGDLIEVDGDRGEVRLLAG